MRVFLAGFCLLLTACSWHGAPARTGTSRSIEITRDTTWQGVNVIDGAVKVFKGATLTILPGSEVRFVRRDDDRDGLGDATLIVEGSLRAIGTQAEPIRFRSAESNPQPGDWLEIRVDFSRETVLRFCDIRDSAHTLHAHFTKAILEDSHIHHNLDGCRLGQGSFILQHNLIEDNEGKGINFRNATVEIRANIIRRNGAGIFLFETDRTPTIAGNNLYDNGDNLRLGDFFHQDLEVGANWWGDSGPEAVAATIYDRDEDATLGRVRAGIVQQWLEGCGPREQLHLTTIDSFASNGFVDAPPLVIGDGFAFASWDGRIRRLDGSGRLLWTQAVGEVVDGGLATDGQRLYGQHWGRAAFALRLSDGAELWRFSYPDSPADDHRQAGVTLAGEQLLVPAWNGTLYALDPATGSERWRLVTPGPLRATPLVDGERIYLPGGDGVLRCLDLRGTLLWSWTTAAPQLSTVALTATGPVVLARNGELTALDRTGTVLWRKVLDELCFYAAPVFDGRDALFVASSAGNVWRLAARTGSTVWRRSGFGPVYATPLLMSNHLLVGDNTGQLSVVGADSATLLATHKVGGAIQGGPIRIGSFVAAGSRDHFLYLLRLSAVAESP